MENLINNKESFTIDKCGLCGSEFYCVMARCPSCGNMLFTSEKLYEEAWWNKKEVLFKTRVKAILESKQNETQAAD